MSLPFTLREKIGQMLIVGFRGAEPAECSLIERDLRDHAVGGIILFDQEMVDATARRRNVVSPDQVKRLVAHLQRHKRRGQRHRALPPGAGGLRQAPRAPLSESSRPKRAYR